MDMDINCALFVLAVFGSYYIRVEAIVTNIGFQDCGSTAVIHRLWVEPCAPFQTGCHLYRNSNVTFNLEFQPGRSYDGFEHQVTGIIFGARVPFSGVQGNACNRLMGPVGCPVTEGNLYNYVNQFGILGSYPRIPVTIEYRLRSRVGENIVCFTMDSKISSRP